MTNLTFARGGVLATALLAIGRDAVGQNIVPRSHRANASAAAAHRAPPLGPNALVYIKDGNVWLLDVDAEGKRQLTTDGGYRSPSLSADGTVGVVHSAGERTEFIRMNPAGQLLSRFSQPASLNTIVTAKLSPDGQTFAFTYQAGEAGDKCFEPGSSGRYECFKLAFTPADRWKPEEGTTQIRYARVDIKHVQWLDDDHLFLNLPDRWVIYYTRSTRDEKYFDTYDEAKVWYKLGEAALSRDGRVMAAGRRWYEPDYNHPDSSKYGEWELAIYRRDGDDFRFATDLTVATSGVALSPSFSRDGSALAFADDDGVYVVLIEAKKVGLLEKNARQPTWRP
jgi:hypothetical protein